MAFDITINFGVTAAITICIVTFFAALCVVSRSREGASSDD